MKKIDIQKLYLDALRPSDTEQVIELIIQSSNINDPYINGGFYTLDTLKKYYEDLIPKFFKAEELYNKQYQTKITFNFAYKYEGKIIASILKIYVPLYFQLFKGGEVPGLQIMKKVDWSKQPKGVAVYCDGFAVHKDYMQEGIGKKILMDSKRYLFSKGVKINYGVAASKISVGIAMKSGGEIIYEQDFRKQNLSIKQYVTRIKYENLFNQRGKL